MEFEHPMAPRGIPRASAREAPSAADHRGPRRDRILSVGLVVQALAWSLLAWGHGYRWDGFPRCATDLRPMPLLGTVNLLALGCVLLAWLAFAARRDVRSGAVAVLLSLGYCALAPAVSSVRPAYALTIADPCPRNPDDGGGATF